MKPDGGDMLQCRAIRKVPKEGAAAGGASRQQMEDFRCCIKSSKSLPPLPHLLFNWIMLRHAAITEDEMNMK